MSHCDLDILAGWNSQLINLENWKAETLIRLRKKRRSWSSSESVFRIFFKTVNCCVTLLCWRPAVLQTKRQAILQDIKIIHLEKTEILQILGMFTHDVYHTYKHGKKGRGYKTKLRTLLKKTGSFLKLAFIYKCHVLYYFTWVSNS